MGSDLANVSEQVFFRPARVLGGWLAEAEAVQVLLGRAPNAGEDVSTQRQAAAGCRAAALELPPFIVEDALRDCTDDRLTSVASRPEVIAAFHPMTWRPALVDLTRVLSFQKLISVDGLEERVRGIDAGDLARLLDLCIPPHQVAPPTSAVQDTDGKGFTISSVNPNLRLIGGQISGAMIQSDPTSPPVPVQAVTLFVTMGTSYLQIVRYKGRFFVRDGYHRAAALLRGGISVVPCIFIEAASFEQLGCPPGSLSYEVLFGERPPRLSDFWGPAACDAQQLAIRKVVRVRGEEFAVPR
jgi:hypothetical protein